MKTIRLLPLFALICPLIFSGISNAAPDKEKRSRDKDRGKEKPSSEKLLDTFKTDDGKYTIIVDSTAAPDLRPWFQKKAIPAVIVWYPKICELILSTGDRPPKTLTLTLENGEIMKGHPGVPAYASGDSVVCSSEFMRNEKEGEAIGCIIHEMVHVVQSGVENNECPGWAIEGVADWVRWFEFEPEKKGAELSSSEGAKYDASYRTSANFLNYVYKKHDKEIIKKLTKTKKTGYSDRFWVKETGKTIDELEALWKKSLD